MGDPKQPRKTFKKPRRPWNTDQLMNELQIIGTYGLRNKRELWKAQTELSRIRHRARDLLALPGEVRISKEKELLSFLNRLGLVSENATLDDVLSLTVENLLERRLQSVVLRKFAKTPNQARQLVIHKHIMINDKIVNIPSYVVGIEEEAHVSLKPGINITTPT